MHRIEAASFIVKRMNKFFKHKIHDYEFVKDVCRYFDLIKNESLSPSDLKFLKYISNIAGIPHYYDLLFSKFNHEEVFDEFDLNTFSSMLYESTLHVDEHIKIHKYQKNILNMYGTEVQNRFFLSATTSFGKTFLIYEIIKKMQYKNIVLIFPTIALLSENYERIMIDENYSYFHNHFDIHTLSEVTEIGETNIFIFTPERYLSFMDKNSDLHIDFVFVDEIYKIDNEYIIDSINKENERDTAYRVALYHILEKTIDILLVGPYIEFPDSTNTNVNQSFNKFLDKNNFVIIDYNQMEIVNKSINLITSKINKIDDYLTIDLHEYNKVGDKLGKTIYDIRLIDENTIIYTKGAGTAETKARSIMDLPINKVKEISSKLEQLINHLKRTFKVNDWTTIRALENKIGIHHGLIPKYIQKEIISLFNNGDIDVLISTTTITEGVNTSAKNLIVLSSMKGDKPLKTFDAKNIAGRAGRFLHHYSGRVLIVDKNFAEILDGSDNEMKHKNYDESSQKDEIDLFITDNEYLNDNDKQQRENINIELQNREIPNEIMQMYKVISYSDKIKVYDQIIQLTISQRKLLKKFIKQISFNLSLDYDGMKLILMLIYPVIFNEKLKFFIDTTSTIKRGQNRGKEYPILIYMLSAYLSEGYMGSIKYNKEQRGLKTDEAVRQSSTFIYNLLKYQLVKYLGIFNIMYKFIIFQDTGKPFDEVRGIEKLLKKLEYNAITEKGRLASDYGVPTKIIEYYDDEDNKSEIRKTFDNYEESKFRMLESIFNK